MRSTSVTLLGLWLVGAGGACAQVLPEGTYASVKEGCAKLESKTAAELGKDLDFYVFTAKGLTGYQQACDFVNVTARNATSWVATAFCEEAGYSYPDMFAIAKKDESSLIVTRLTDLMQEAAPETPPSAASESGKAAGGEAGGESLAAGEGQDQTEANTGPGEVIPYVRCEHIKQ